MQLEVNRMRENIWLTHAKRQEKKALELYEMGLVDEAKKHEDLTKRFYKNGGVVDYQFPYQKDKKKSKRR